MASHTTPQLSVIILTWNGREYLTECLDSLACQTFRDFETIVVDNGSSDGSARFVRTGYPWVRLLELAENSGFAEGNNRGLALARGGYIVALNNDTKCDPCFLAELVRIVESDAHVGMVAARMRNYFRPEYIDAAGLKIGSNGLGYNVGIGGFDDGRFDDEPLFGPCGGAALYRREMLDETGFFDADFFAYYEDFDLAWRARLAGWDVLAAPQALVYHVHSATSGEMSAFKVYHTQRNKWFVLVKNWPAPLLLRYLLPVLCADLAAFSLALLRGKGVAALRARLAVVVSLGRLLRKRREVQKGRRVTDAEAARFFSPHESMFRTFLRKMRVGWMKDEG